MRLICVLLLRFPSPNMVREGSSPKMKNFVQFALILLLSCFVARVAYSQTAKSEPAQPATSVKWKPTASWLAGRSERNQLGPRLAILVSGFDKNRPQALAIQGLLEAEAFASWHGELMERVQLQALLDEQTLGATLTEANAIKLGKLTQADYLLLVDFQDNRVRCRVNQFPTTTVVTEFDIASASEDRISKQIAFRAFRAIAERSRDPNRVSVAIGSFLIDDPFSNYLDLDPKLHVALRERLSKLARIDLAERFHPTQLLREFELARAGLVPSVVAQLTAPASDVLIVGEVQPTTKQPLDKKDIELQFRIRVILSTGLFESFDVTLVQPKLDPALVADKVVQSIQQLVTRLPQELPRRADAEGLPAEYATLKKLAFRTLLSKPQASGNFFEKHGYRGPSQSGKREEVERAMRAVENVMLLKGDDQQLLVCAAALIYELARETPNDQFQKPTPRQKAMLNQGCDYIETALALDFNYNTRGFAYSAMSAEGYWQVVPERIRPIVERIVREGVDGGWYPFEVEYSRLKLLDKAPDLQSKIDLFRSANRDKSLKPEQRIRLLQTVLRDYLLSLNAKADADLLGRKIRQLRQLADELIDDGSAMSRGMGLYVNLFSSFHSQPRDPAWQDELRKAIDVIPDMAKELGPEFPKSGYSLWIYAIVSATVFPDRPETREFLQRYVMQQHAVQNYRGDSNLSYSILRLLPMLDSDDDRNLMLEIVTRTLEKYNTGGSADFDRMKLARWYKHLQQGLASEKPWQISLVDIPLKSGTDLPAQLSGVPYATRVKKVIWAFDKIWALQCDYWLSDRTGEVYVADLNGQTSTRINGLSERVTDIAASDDQLAVASIDSGLSLLSPTGKILRHLRPGDSPLPTPMVRTVTSDGSRFLIGLPGRNDQTGYGVYFIYELDSQAGTLNQTETKLDYHSYYQTRFDKPKGRVESQTWARRVDEANGHRFTLKVEEVNAAIHQATVTDDAEKPVFRYKGFELNYVYDFITWQDHLVFATGNGLYVARPGSDTLTCLLSELDLEFFSACPVGDKLFLGTNRGLHYIHAADLPK